jgi:hypothetical protein
MAQPKAFGKIKIMFDIIFIFPWKWYFFGYKIGKINPFAKIKHTAEWQTSNGNLFPMNLIT